MKKSYRLDRRKIEVYYMHRKEVFPMPRPSVFKMPARVNLTLDRELLARIKRLAKRDHRSISQVIRDVMRDYLEGMLLDRRKSFSDVAERIKRLRESLPPSKIGSVEILRTLRQKGRDTSL